MPRKQFVLEESISHFIILIAIAQGHTSKAEISRSLNKTDSLITRQVRPWINEKIVSEKKTGKGNERKLEINYDQLHSKVTKLVLDEIKKIESKLPNATKKAIKDLSTKGLKQSLSSGLTWVVFNEQLKNYKKLLIEKPDYKRELLKLKSPTCLDFFISDLAMK